jgi:indolepyruvate ferredoxin oxidoreductase
VRGTRFDPFGRTEMRRTERALIEEYTRQIDDELERLDADPDDIDGILTALALPMEIRGYEDLKLRRVADYRAAVAARRSSIPDR